MRKLFVFPAALALGLTSLAAGADAAPINGAFGIEFGSHFKPDHAVEVRPAGGGGHVYIIDKPPEPYGPLKQYSVSVTADGRVYEIVGSGQLSSAKECDRQQDFIAGVVARKYGAAAELKAQDELIRRTVLRKGNRYVEVICVGPGLDVRYRDRTLAERSVTPTEEKPAPRQGISKAGQADTSGL